MNRSENKWITIENRGSHLYIVYKPNNTMGLSEAKEIIHFCNDFGAEKCYPVFCDIRHMPTHDTNVRNYMANEGGERVVANAIFTDSFFSKILANFFMTLSKPKVPTKLFTEEAAAIKWLSQYKVREFVRV